MHVLEHFRKTYGERFIGEYYMGLRKERIIRLAVPDLQRIVWDYSENLEKKLVGDQQAKLDYKGIKFEFNDQI